MTENYHLLIQLEQMLKWKKSRKFYADRLGISEQDVDELVKELKRKEEIRNEAECASYISELEDRVVKYQEDIENGSAELIFNSKEEIKTLDELIQKCNIDTSVWEITKYIQNFWGNEKDAHWQVKAWMSKKKNEQVFQDAFVNFLSTYQPSSQDIVVPKIHFSKKNACLVINKQDAHLNKYDIDGKNDITDRFASIMEKTELILNQASLSNNIDKITYIIGSDEFNSEFTGTTTKGTPQQNILTYHDSFKRICEHEIQMITLLLANCSSVDVIYVAGNHDEYVGWHMINWLSTFFRTEDRVKFDTSPKYRKYVGYGESAMMFNHGDAIKPSKLAGIFPMEFRDAWSFHNNFYIFTGDKHHEVSQDINGIKFFQIPAFSNSKSLWDDKNGHVCARGEVTAFLIDFFDGMTNIFKQYL